MAKKTLSVTINDSKITRTTERNYTHAVAVLPDYDRARKLAYENSPAEVKVQKNNFDYFARIVVAIEKHGLQPDKYGREDHRLVTGMGLGYYYSLQEIERSQEIVAGGFEKYLEDCRERRIEQFEQRVRTGEFTWGVYGWCGTYDLACRQARSLQGKNYWSDVAIVEVGKEITLPGDRK